MRLKNHVHLLSWTLGDKALFLGYGVVTWFQIRALAPEEYALAAQLITLQAWITIVVEGSLLQSIIQYGQSSQDRGRANTLALFLSAAFTMTVAFAIAVASSPLSTLFHEPRFSDVARILPLLCLFGIPRSYALKLLQREFRAREVFITNAAWLGSMGIITLILLGTEKLRSFEDMAVIVLTGMAVSSIVGLTFARELLELSWQGTVTFRTIMKFSFPQALMMVLNTSIRQLDIFIIQFFFSTRASGIYNAAKMLFRIFETGADAVLWLTYPATVRLLHQQRREDLSHLISKGLMLQWIVAIGAVSVFEAGATDILVSFLGMQYDQTATLFKIMTLGALFLPLSMLQAVLLALHRVGSLLTITMISLVCAMLVYGVIGLIGNLHFVGLGVVAYYVLNGIMLWYSLRRERIIRYSTLISALLRIVESLLRRSTPIKT